MHTPTNPSPQALKAAEAVVRWSMIQRNVLLNEFSIQEIIEREIAPLIAERDRLRKALEYTVEILDKEFDYRPDDDGGGWALARAALQQTEDGK